MIRMLVVSVLLLLSSKFNLFFMCLCLRDFFDFVFGKVVVGLYLIDFKVVFNCKLMFLVWILVWVKFVILWLTGVIIWLVILISVVLILRWWKVFIIFKLIKFLLIMVVCLGLFICSVWMILFMFGILCSECVSGFWIFGIGGMIGFVLGESSRKL